MVDSERMLADIAQAGFLIAAEPEDAEVVVINTCGFIAPAQAEALEAIEQAAVWKRQGRVNKVVVAGCLPQRLGRELLEQVSGIDAIVGLGQRDDIAGIIEETIPGLLKRLSPAMRRPRTSSILTKRMRMRKSGCCVRRFTTIEFGCV
jgi:ribosomal protein S12 methylthiotransferase